MPSSRKCFYGLWCPLPSDTKDRSVLGSRLCVVPKMSTPPLVLVGCKTEAPSTQGGTCPPAVGRAGTSYPSLALLTFTHPFHTAWLSQPIPQQPPPSRTGSEAVTRHPCHPVRSYSPPLPLIGPVLQGSNSIIQEDIASVTHCCIAKH